MQTYTRIRWLFLLMAGLVILLFPASVLAQEGTARLDMFITSSTFDGIKTGKDNIYLIEVRNRGDTEIHDIRFTAKPPEGWSILFEPPEIAYLGLNGAYTIDVNVKPPAGAEQDNYQIILIAEANETRATTTLWVTVQEPSFWLWVGIILASIIIAVFIFIYMRLGRTR